ncbi:putative phage abortive infection protein [Flavobacterium ginsenosidimutans]|uniref:Phage abortive infection protein n=1 Tax=Flavobacterium ginsenosidimutans TaxID=687844 RepID=A0ABZ2Q4F8_9FLAO|nr:putative phage abortive infection protein [Flavobacterium ginsenosidimutans]KAF2327831.1 hypothetical protein DM444_18690 [Flavobacterium ginsenosidimutans]
MIFFSFLSSVIAAIAFFFSGYFLLHKFGKNAKNKKSSTVIISLCLLAISAFLLAIILNFTNDLLVNPNLTTVDYGKIGPYGDLIGGILNPIIAFIGIIAASLAFYAQFIANQQVQEQFTIQQFESQFYERLNLAKEEINNIYLPLKNGSTLTGRKVFYELDKEIKFIYFIVSNILTDKPIEIKFKIAYKIFYMGRKFFFEEKNILFLSDKYNIRKKDFLELDDILDSIYRYIIKDKEQNKTLTNEEDLEVSTLLEKLDIKEYDTLFQDLLFENYHYSYLIFIEKYGIKFNHIPFKGMETKLSLIIRQLYSLVKYVANNDFLSYHEKRNYLRVLRSILSNYEQLHIFYNWYSGTGSEWENNENKFLTDFRIIHNLPPTFLIEGLNLKIIFSDTNFNYEENKKDRDSLFEQVYIISTRK